MSVTCLIRAVPLMDPRNDRTVTRGTTMAHPGRRWWRGSWVRVAKGTNRVRLNGVVCNIGEPLEEEEDDDDEEEEEEKEDEELRVDEGEVSMGIYEEGVAEMQGEEVEERVGVSERGAKRELSIIFTVIIQSTALRKSESDGAS